MMIFVADNSGFKAATQKQKGAQGGCKNDGHFAPSFFLLLTTVF